jgi:hypothetical protein
MPVLHEHEITSAKIKERKCKSAKIEEREKSRSAGARMQKREI